MPASAGPCSIKRARHPPRPRARRLLWSRSMSGISEKGLERARCRKGSSISSECSMVVGDGRHAKAERLQQVALQLLHGLLVHRDIAERGGVGLVGGGEQRLVIGVMHGGEHHHHIRRQPAQNGKGIPGHRTGVQVPGVGGHHGDHLTGQLRQAGVVDITVDRAPEPGGVAGVPLPGDGRRTDIGYFAHLIRFLTNKNIVA